ncbi:MAG: hypothetical protein H7Z72_06385 [Bacteroidetes bacterium]|nr:hypothetical protein [Fibrella sp.]
MVPTFLQKRRGNGHALRLGLALAGLILLFMGCVVALSMILIDRDMDRLDKVVFISGMLLGFLLGTGLLARARR